MRRSGRFSVALVTHESGIRYPAHSHERAYLLLALAGEFVDEARDVEDHVAATDFVYMPAGVVHSNRIGPVDNRSLLITLEPGFAQRAGAPARRRVVRGGRIARLLLRVRRVLDEVPPEGDCTMAELVIEALDCTHPQTGAQTRAPPACVRIALERLHAGCDRDVSLATLAAHGTVDPCYLARSFRRAHGTTIGEYARGLRVRAAAALIGREDCALADVALVAGFADQSHLCRVFKRQYGVTPGEYRRLARERGEVNPVQD